MRRVVWVTWLLASCASPAYTLVPAPTAGGAPSPVSARIERVATTDDVLNPSRGLGPRSRIVVELEVENADPERPAPIERPGLRLEDVLGGRPVYAGPIEWRETWPLVLAPGERRTLRVMFAGFPVDSPTTPVRASVFVPVQGRPPLELAIADPVPGGPRWQGERISAAYISGSFSTVSNVERLHIYDLGFAYRWSSETVVGGIAYRCTEIEREALAAAPHDFGFSLLGEARWQTTLLGVYFEGGAFVGFESPPKTDASAQAGSSRTVALPRLGVGISLAAGRILGSPLFPIYRPPTALRRLGFLAGYTQWFHTGDKQPVHGFQFSLETAYWP